MFEDLNTAEFLSDLKNGSPAAFELLADRMFKPLWRFLVYHLGVSGPDAEEIVQDTLLKVYSSVRSFRRTDRARFTTWVTQIAQNLAIDFGRRRKLPTKQLKNENPPSGAPREEPAHRNRAFLLWLRDELAKMPADDQRILLWREEDHSYELIAKWLGIQVVTARVRHKRAKDRIIEAANRLEFFGSNGVHDVAESGVTYE